MRAYYCDQFVLPLPEGHRFPMAKYSRLRARVLEQGILSPAELEVPPAASDDQLLLAHDGGYVRRVVAGELTVAEVRRLGFPWSPQMVERSRRSVGGTIAACRAALAERVAVNLAGGTHHAFADRGEGFCVFNDVAVAIRVAQQEGHVRRVAVLDCDVHQGNGTAAIFHGDDDVFTLSIHGAGNYPFEKVPGDLDVALPDGTGDDEYLAALETALDRAVDRFTPELAVYLAGADPFEGDRFGRLALSRAGLAERDAAVFRRCASRGIPVAVVMSGGYAPHVDHIVDIHAETVRQAVDLERDGAAAAMNPPGGETWHESSRR